jgi:hypothetical protein
LESDRGGKVRRFDRASDAVEIIATLASSTSPDTRPDVKERSTARNEALWR